MNAEVGNSKEEGGRWKAEAQKAYGRRIAHLIFSALGLKGSQKGNTSCPSSLRLRPVRGPLYECEGVV